VNLIKQYKEWKRRRADKYDSTHSFESHKEFSQAWDTRLNNLLDSHKIVSVGSCTVVLDNHFEIWIANKWFAYGTLNSPDLSDFLPSKKTASRLNRAVTNFLIDAEHSRQNHRFYAKRED